MDDIQVTAIGLEPGDNTFYLNLRCPFGKCVSTSTGNSPMVGSLSCGLCKYFLSIDKNKMEVICTGKDR